MSEKTERSCWPGTATDTKPTEPQAAGVTQLPGSGAGTPRGKEDDKSRSCFGGSDTEAPKETKAPKRTWLPFGRRKEYRDLPLDIYGMTILSFVRDFSYIAKSRNVPRHNLRLYYVLASLGATIVMQVCTLMWVSHYVVSPAVRNIQLNYQSYHRAVFDQEGSFSDEKWRTYIGAKDLCNSALMDRSFLGVVLCCWLARILFKAKDTISLAYYAQCLPPVPQQSGEDLMIDVKMVLGEELHIIVGLTNWVRAALHLLVTLPKLLILFWVMRLGLRWIAATDDLSSLIVTVVSLEFISSIDELILRTLLPETTMEYVMTTKLAIPQAAKFEEDEHKSVQRDYHISIGLLILTVGFAFCYAYFFQQVIPFYSGDVNPHRCLTFYGHDRLCNPFEKDCILHTSYHGQSAQQHGFSGVHTGGSGALPPSPSVFVHQDSVPSAGKPSGDSLPTALPEQPQPPSENQASENQPTPQPSPANGGTADLFPSMRQPPSPPQSNLEPPAPSPINAAPSPASEPDNVAGLDAEALAHYRQQGR